MARLARIVIPGVAHHVTQRGNRRQRTFFQPSDYQEYLSLMKEWCQKSGVAIWAYCLMPNHIHLIAVPKKEDSLRAGIAEAHRRYTRHINFQKRWRGHLWQERFHSYPVDEAYLYEAVRYVELNPIRGGLVQQAKQYRWSSARAHLMGKDDDLVNVGPMLDRVEDWGKYLREGVEKDRVRELELHMQTGRPLGTSSFIRTLEQKTGRVLRKMKPGPLKKG